MSDDKGFKKPSEISGLENDDDVGDDMTMMKALAFVAYSSTPCSLANIG